MGITIKYKMADIDLWLSMLKKGQILP